MEEPSRRSSRLALAGGLAAAIACAAAGFVAGRATSPAPAPVRVEPARPVARPSPAPSDTGPVAPSILGRGDLIGIGRAAADAYTAGVEPPAPTPTLDGRRFEIRLPFGCGGPTEAADAPLGWRYDEKTGTLRLQARPVRWIAAAWLPPDAAAGVESMDGFWISRPWTASEACPAGSPSPAAPAPPPDETLGLVTFASATGSRVGRRAGEAFTAVKKLDRDALDVGGGFRLRLTGRLASAPGGRSVLCQSPGGPARRPICLIAAALDEVAIENGATGETLATWIVSQPSGDEATAPSAGGGAPRR